mmetsp:Transcript_140814/g.450173  ORF Transcript_140814/g.450173 Transcript_140814/m.450173 type:complete len:279 (-) Transcript_140814:506-1342(-)
MSVVVVRQPKDRVEVQQRAFARRVWQTWPPRPLQRRCAILCQVPSGLKSGCPSPAIHSQALTRLQRDRALVSMNVDALPCAACRPRLPEVVGPIEQGSCWWRKVASEVNRRRVALDLTSHSDTGPRHASLELLRKKRGDVLGLHPSHAIIMTPNLHVVAGVGTARIVPRVVVEQNGSGSVGKAHLDRVRVAQCLSWQAAHHQDHRLPSCTVVMAALEYEVIHAIVATTPGALLGKCEQGALASPNHGRYPVTALWATHTSPKDRNVGIDACLQLVPAS